MGDTATNAAADGQGDGSQEQQQNSGTQEGQGTIQQTEDVSSLPEWAQTLITRTRSEAAQHRVKAKENASAAERLAKIEDEKKTETERLTEASAAAIARAEKAELGLLRSTVAAAKGLTPAQAKRLAGTTQEELEADADDLLASFPAGSAAAQMRLTQGTRTDGPAGKAQWTQADLEGKSNAEIMAAKKDGKLDRLLGMQ